MQPAVFAKNHLAHLKAAVEISDADSKQLVTFRSSRRWAEASRLLQASGGSPLPILYGVVERGPEAHFGARLQEILLGPNPTDRRARELLQFRPHTTMEEDWWNDDVKTIYAVSGLRELKPPIPYSSLLKQADGTPLSCRE